jgi:serine/threonine protein kinase
MNAQLLRPNSSESNESWDFEAGHPIAAGRTALKRMGGGTRYEVYLAWDEHLHALVVAKILRPHLVEDARALEELSREADMLARLAHPVLLRGFGVVVEGPHPHLVIEHLEGPTLSRLIKRQGTLPLEQLRPVTLHIAAALHYLGREGVVHLDVKPSNIVVSLPPRLIDLSIARPVRRAARLGSPIGTDAYMAPEQCDPLAHPNRIGPATDVWGLGATLHHAIAGEVPFPRPREARWSEDYRIRFPQLEVEPLHLEGRTPAPLADLVLRMLARDPDDRPLPEEVAEVLEPLVVLPPRKRQIRGPFP